MEYTTEYLISFIAENWVVICRTIVQGAVMGVAYFLIFLYRSKVTGAKRDLSVMFREKTNEVTTADLRLRADVDYARDVMQQELIEAKTNYQNAINEIADLKRRLTRTEDTVQELIDEEVDYGK